MDTNSNSSGIPEKERETGETGADEDQFYRVEDILKYNLAKQREHEKPIEAKETKTRKTRDYLICMILVNTILILPNIVFGMNVVVMIFSFSGVVIFSSGFTWIMWKVIGEY